MQLKIALEDKKLDQRLVDRLLAEGKITNDDVKKYLESLPDDSANVKYIEQDQK